MKISFKSIIGPIAVLSVFIFSVLMLNTIRQYFSFQTNVGFLKFKQEIINNKYWLFFFYTHIFSIIVCLLAGLTQFSAQLQRENGKTHRLIGKIYVYNILLINVPACFILALFSNGGYWGVIGFLVQNFLWAYFTISAILHIKKKRLEKHRNFMMLSYAITTTAITFRIIKNLLFDENQYSYELFYGINVWASLLINLAIAFLIIKYNPTSLSLKGNRINKNND